MMSCGYKQIIRDIKEGKLLLYLFRLVVKERRALGVYRVQIGACVEVDVARDNIWIHHSARNLTIGCGYTSTVGSIAPCIRRREQRGRIQVCHGVEREAAAKR